MARPPHAREKVLDAFTDLLLEEGERAATMDATAKRAGVSKGGLLYHFASKIALEDALIGRLDALMAQDLAAMTASPAGVVDAFIRTSVNTDDDLDRALTAVGRLASNGDARASEALARSRDAWREVLRPAVPDETALTLVMLVADGVYFNQTLTLGTVPQIADLDALIALVSRVCGRPLGGA